MNPIGTPGTGRSLSYAVAVAVTLLPAGAYDCESASTTLSIPALPGPTYCGVNGGLVVGAVELAVTVLRTS